MEAIKLLKDVINENLCCGCGGCMGICPSGALSIVSREEKRHEPVLYEEKCIGCNLCYKICPGKGWKPVAYAKELCERENISFDSLYGPVKGYFLGKSQNDGIALAGASGGIGTSLLLYLLDHNIVDSVITVGMENGIPKVRVTNDRQLVMNAAGSKYSPVSVMDKAIKTLRTNTKRMAITVIPCQMAALENAIRSEKIRRDLIYTIGLFCGDVKDYVSVEQVAKSMGLYEKSEYEFLGWRYGIWPGKASFRLKRGGEEYGKRLQRWLGISKPCYTLARCLMCPSRENWLADIALADNHRGQTDETVIVARTAKGLEMLRNAQENGLIRLREIEYSREESFEVSLTKYTVALVLIKHMRKHGRPFPQYDYDEKLYLSRANHLSRIISWLKNIMFLAVRNKYIKGFLERHPRVMEYTGFFINRFPVDISMYRLMRELKKSFQNSGHT